MKFFLLIIIILIISSLIILESNHLKISEKEDIKTFRENYSNWTGEVYSNMQKVTGQIIKLDWLP